jgi:hypothetical protein
MGNPASHRRYEQHADVRARLGFRDDFVLDWLRHAFGIRLGETGGDAFTIMRLVGHSSMTVSEEHVHPATAAMRLPIGGNERQESQN